MTPVGGSIVTSHEDLLRRQAAELETFRCKEERLRAERAASQSTPFPGHDAATGQETSRRRTSRGLITDLRPH
jgi:hypothetical protein